MIYLDNASGIPLLNEVKENINNNLDYCYNPSASYSKGQLITSEIYKTREIIANTFNANPNNVIFTSGATEANNLAIFGYKQKRENRYNIGYLGFEHNSVIKPLKYLKKQGYKLVKLSYNDIVNDIDKVIEELKRKDISFLILNHIYSGIGILLPLEKIVKVIKNEIPRIYIHIDAAQSFMKVDLKINNIDSISVSGHKIGALQGIGALILKNNQLISPFIIGGKQNFSMRGGTENILGILSFRDALGVWNNNKENFRKKIFDLNIYFRKQFEAIFANNNKVKIITPNIHYSNNIVTIAMKDILSEHVIRYLDEENIMISSSSTCSDLNYIPPFLNTVNLEKYFYNGIIRISFSAFNKREQIDTFFNKFKGALEYF